MQRDNSPGNDDPVEPADSGEKKQEDARQKVANEAKAAREQKRRDDESLKWFIARFKDNEARWKDDEDLKKQFEFFRYDPARPKSEKGLIDLAFEGFLRLTSPRPVIDVNQRVEVLHEELFREENELPSTANFTVTSGDVPKRMLPDGVYFDSHDPMYAIEVTDKGIRPVDIHKFTLISHTFDHEKYYNKVFAAHEMRNETVIGLNFKEYRNITEEKLEKAIRAAIAHGIEFKETETVTKFLNSDSIFGAKGDTTYKETIDHKMGADRRLKIRSLIADSVIARQQREKELKVHLDPLQADGYQTQNKNDLDDFTHLDKNKEIKKKLADLNSKSVDSLDDRQSLIDKSEEVLSEITQRLENIESIEKRLNDEEKLYGGQEAEIKNLSDKERLEKIQNFLPDSQKTHDREALIAQLKTERNELKNHQNQVNDKIKQLANYYEHDAPRQSAEADKKIVAERLPAIKKQDGLVGKKLNEVENKIVKLEAGKDTYKQKIDDIKTGANQKMASISAARLG